MTTTATAPAATSATTTWSLDASHSSVEFAVKHMMITTVKGSFADVAGTLSIPGDDLAQASVNVTIQTASVTTRNEQRDGHLRSPDFFDAEKFPTITFASKSVTKQAAGYALVGDLTMHGVTKEVTLAVTDNGAGKDPWGGTRRSFEATGLIDRRDFGLEWNAALETGGVLVSTDVKLSFDLQFVQQQA